MTQLVTFTEAAITHLKHMMEKEKALGFRLSIKKTGCSGYAYVPAMVTEIKETDIHFTEEGLPIYIDPDCEKLIDGLVIDFVTQNNMGLKQTRLVFINPNEKNRCGCGESFTIE